MEPFYVKFPEIAEKETRCLSVRNHKELPNGEFYFTESYCNDLNCDCRRVFINVIHNEKIVATIGYGWEDVKFYEEWVGEKELAQEMCGTRLEVNGPCDKLAKKLLKIFEEEILKDQNYIERLKRHYELFKGACDKKDLDIENYNIVELCDGVGTCFDEINEQNLDIFIPLLWGIEEAIWMYFLEDSSLKDYDVIKALKNIKENLFVDEDGFEGLEEKIVMKMKKALYNNDYGKKDVRMALARVINSVKRHRYVEGDRGYLKFITEFFKRIGKEELLEKD